MRSTRTFWHYLPHGHFSAPSLQQLVQSLSGKFGEHEGVEGKWGINGLFNGGKKISGRNWSLCVILVACFASINTFLQEGGRWQGREAKENTSFFETAKIPIRHMFSESLKLYPTIDWPHVLPVLPFFPGTSVASMGPALEEFGVGFRYSSPTCDSACHFLGLSSSNVSERESIIANFTVVGATFNSYWYLLVALILGDSRMACRWSSCSLSCIAKDFLAITWQLFGTSGMQHKQLLYPVFSVW